jgi:hypothetical protein
MLEPVIMAKFFSLADSLASCNPRTHRVIRWHMGLFAVEFSISDRSVCSYGQ